MYIDSMWQTSVSLVMACGMVTAIKAVELRDNLKNVCNRVVAGETVILTRPGGGNVVLISEKEYNLLLSAAKTNITAGSSDD